LISELLFTILDLQYDIGGCPIDIGAPIYISDLRYDIGGVLFVIGAPIYYIGPPI